MRLLTAHRILIGVFIVFCAFFGAWEFNQWQGGGGAVNVVLALGSWTASGAFSAYLYNLRHRTPDL